MLELYYGILFSENYAWKTKDMEGKHDLIASEFTIKYHLRLATEEWTRTGGK